MKQNSGGKVILEVAAGIAALSAVAVTAHKWLKERRKRELKEKEEPGEKRFDKHGYDTDGYNKAGFDRDGFNREGLDRQGYDRTGYNCEGTDRVGQGRLFYKTRTVQLLKYLEVAYAEMLQGEYGHALYECRRVLEETLKQHIKHFCGELYLEDTIQGNLRVCLERNLLGEVMYKDLEVARRICNRDPHEFDFRESIDWKEVNFVIGSIQEYVERVIDDLVYRQ